MFSALEEYYTITEIFRLLGIERHFSKWVYAQNYECTEVKQAVSLR